MRKGLNIHKRKDGRWEGRYLLNDKYKSVYGRTYQETKNKLQSLILNKESNHKCANKQDVIFKDMYEQFITSKRAFLKESTLATYHYLYNKHLIQIKDYSIADLEDKNKLYTFINQKKHLSAKYINNILLLLKSIYKFWTNKELIINKFKTNKKEQKTFQPNEILKLIMYFKNNIEDPIAFGCYLALLSGIRVGELCALTVGDINKQTPLVIIDKTLERIYNKNEKPKTKIIIDKPKSLDSVREIPLPYFMIEPIIDQNDTNYILTKSKTFMEPRTFYKKYKKLLEKIGIEYKKFHTFRHTFATYALKSHCIDIKTLSMLLGHSEETVTLKEYTHSDILTKKEQLSQFYIYLDNLILDGQNYGQSMKDG